MATRHSDPNWKYIVPASALSFSVGVLMLILVGNQSPMERNCTYPNTVEFSGGRWHCTLTSVPYDDTTDKLEVRLDILESSVFKCDGELVPQREPAGYILDSDGIIYTSGNKILGYVCRTTITVPIKSETPGCPQCGKP